MSSCASLCIASAAENYLQAPAVTPQQQQEGCKKSMVLREGCKKSMVLKEGCKKNMVLKEGCNSMVVKEKSSIHVLQISGKLLTEYQGK